MTDLSTLLRDAEPDVTMDVPVHIVVRRGSRLRRRRRVAVAVGVTAALASAATLTSLATGPGPERSVATDQTSGPPMIDLATVDLSQADRECRAKITGPAYRLGDLFAAGRMTEDTVLLYHGTGPDGGPVTTICTPDGPAVGAGTDPVTAAEPSTGSALVGEITIMTGGRGDRASTLVMAGRASAQVRRVVATVDGRTVEAAVDQGWFWFWAPEAPEAAAGSGDRVIGYDEHGRVLGTIDLDAVSVPPPPG